jgi:hypothetical protein
MLPSSRYPENASITLLKSDFRLIVACLYIAQDAESRMVGWDDEKRLAYIIQHIHQAIIRT